MRLIDADAYLESIKPRGISDELWKECKEYKSVMSFASAQSEVIRCKDCKHWNERNCVCAGIRVDCTDYYVGDIVTEEKRLLQ